MSLSDPPAAPLPDTDFRQLFESSPELFLVLDASDKYRITAASDAYLRATMKERDAIVGCPVFVVFPDNPDDPASANHEAFRAALARARQTGQPETVPVYQYDLPLPGGAGFEEHLWQTSVWPVFAAGGRAPGQRPVALLCRTEDVTRQMLSDAAMGDARSRLEATLGAAEIGTWIWEVASDRVTADRNLAQMFGVDPADAAGRTVGTLHAPHPRGGSAARAGRHRGSRPHRPALQHGIPPPPT